MNTSNLNALLPLLDKLGAQVENALLTPDGISLLDKDLLKETLRRFYDTVNDLPVVNGVNGKELPFVPSTPVAAVPTVAADVMATMIAQGAMNKTEAPVIEPIQVTANLADAETGAAEKETPVVEIEEPVVATVINTVEATVVETTKEDVPQPVNEEIAQVSAVQQEPVVIMSKPAVENKVVETRSKHLHAAAMFEEQATVAAKYTAAETLSDKVTRESTTRRLSDQLKSSPLADLKSSIGINERFAFINELFSGDQQSYLQSIERINHLQAYEEARQLIHGDLMQKYNWKPQSERFIQFDELVKRRFNA